MRVLLINVVCGIRSTGRLCTDLAETLEAQGHEVKIAYGRETVPQQFQKYAVRIGSDIDNKIHGLQARLMDGAGFGSKRATRAFLEKVREFDPDVIHLHNLHGYYVNVEILFDYLKTCGKRVIWTLHDCWAFTGHSATCDAVDCTRWETGCYDCPNLKEYPASYSDHSSENWHKKKAVFSDVPDMTIITPSRWLAGLVRESFLQEYPVEVIYNGIDTSQFYPMESDFKERLGIKDKKMLLGVATAWNEMKGFSDYLKLADMLDEKYRIVMVGLTAKQIDSLPPSIIGLEKTNSPKELAMIYSAADILLNLSYCESFSMINIEAQLCGTPVISYKTGGCVETGGNNAVIEKGDLEAVKEALEGNVSIQVIGKEIEKDTMTSRYIEVYTRGTETVSGRTE